MTQPDDVGFYRAWTPTEQHFIIGDPYIPGAYVAFALDNFTHETRQCSYMVSVYDKPERVRLIPQWARAPLLRALLETKETQ